MTHQAFISYNSKDKQEAESLLRILEEGGVECWMAPRDIPAGRQYYEFIESAIETSKVVALLISGNTEGSKYVSMEVDYALSQSVSVLPIRMSEVPLPKGLRFLLGSLQHLDAFPLPITRHASNILTAAKSLAGSEHEIPEDQTTEQPVVDSSPEAPPKSIIDAAHDAEELVCEELRKRGRSPAVAKNLLILTNARQKMWLTFTNDSVYCVLDNRLKNGRISIPWSQMLTSLNEGNISAIDRNGKPGLLNIGERRNWLFTKSLFGGAENLKRVIMAEVVRARTRSHP